MTSDLPSFEEDSDITVINAPPAKSIHELLINEKPAYWCDPCQKEFDAQKGLSSHNSYKHSPKAKDLYKSDVLRLLVPHSRDTVYDAKLKVWVYNSKVIIPEGYMLHKIINYDKIHKVSPDQPQNGSFLEIIVVKEPIAEVLEG